MYEKYLYKCKTANSARNVGSKFWKSYFWHPFLCGSVISFLRIHDFKKEFIRKATVMMNEHEEQLKNVQALKLLSQ
jgi:hypothetical protein